MVDHDGNFKRLLSMYFVEFIDLFFPELMEFFDEVSTVQVDKEIFEIFEDDKREADLVVKAKTKEKESYFLIHIEAQAKRDEHFGRRMLKYCVWLHEKYGLPVYPIALFTWSDTPRWEQPGTYTIESANFQSVRFEYRVVQLNRLDYRNFITLRNPVAVALTTKMRIEEHERLDVAFECLVNSQTQDLSPEGKNLLGFFIRDYLKIEESKIRDLYKKAERLEGEAREGVMRSLDSWTEYGIEQGRLQECVKIVLRQLAHRFGTLDESTAALLGNLSLQQMEQLAEDMLDFESISELDSWLARQD